MTALDGRWRRRPSFLVYAAVSWMAIGCLAALGADLLAPFDYCATDILNRLTPPLFFGDSMTHPLGTDQLGRDVLSRLIHATRISLFIAIVGTLVGAALGVMLGFLAATFRGLIDDIVMMLVDVQSALPYLVVALTAIAFFGTSLWLFLLVIGLYGWERYARLARAAALTALERGYARAVFGFGASWPYLFSRHILPNVAGVLVVNVTLNLPESILLESSLSFLGLGVQPPETSLGP